MRSYLILLPLPRPSGLTWWLLGKYMLGDRPPAVIPQVVIHLGEIPFEGEDYLLLWVEFKGFPVGQVCHLLDFFLLKKAILKCS